MSARIYALTVALEQDVREDDVQPLIDAIKQMRGVADVNAHVSDIAFRTALIRARRTLADALWKVLEEPRI